MPAGTVGDVISSSHSRGIGVTLGCKAPAEGDPEPRPWSLTLSSVSSSAPSDSHFFFKYGIDGDMSYMGKPPCTYLGTY